ncbi:MAG: hypothetical protein K2Q10_09180, partial [Rhodospirillales bacterium]|nr:hypothetical protein [Rhodospirillales bacterium]
RLLPHLAPGIQSLSRQLMENLAEDGRAQVAALHKALFAASTPASANASLNRLLATLNKAAVEHGAALEMKITPDKKAGAAKRWVWCEGEASAPATPHTGDLNAIPEAIRQTHQKVLVLGKPVVLLTFNEHETRAVLNCFTGTTSPRVDMTGAYPVNHLGVHNGMEIRHLVSKQGRLDAGMAAAEAIQRLNPCAVIAVGIGFGIDSAKQHIGDVLVSECLCDYETGRVNKDGGFTPRGGRPQAADRLLRRIRDLHHKRGERPDWPRLHIGMLMCGDKLIDHRPSRDMLLKIAPEAIGGEMEGSGIEMACRESKVDWIVIKGISDWADGGKNNATKDADQRRAADNAALVVKAMLDMGVLDPLDPPPKLPVPAQPAALLTDRQQLPEGHYQRDIKCMTVSLGKDLLAAAPADRETPGEDVLPYLRNWVQDPKAPPLLALLGEYGMGKTVTCQQFVEELNEARKDDARLPLALYFDLRHVTRRKER